MTGAIDVAGLCKSYGKTVALDGRTIGVDAGLENRGLFGSVNARRGDWGAGVAAPGAARRRRVPPPAGCPR